MPKKSKVISNPFLNAFTYDTIRRIVDEQKVKLNGRYLKYLKNARTANAFSSTADIEDRAILLSKLGVDFAWVFGPLNSEALTQQYKEYKAGHQAKASATMMEQGIFVVTNREIMKLLGLMASNAHTETYLLNRTFNNAGYHIRKWAKDINHPSNAAIRDGISSAREVSKIIYNSILSAKDTQGFAGITDCSMCILLYLFSREAYDVLESDIRGKIQPMFQPAKVALGLKKLVECKYIERTFRDDRKPAYLISATGIDVAMRFQKKILNISFNF